MANFEVDVPEPAGLKKMNRHHLRRDYRDYLEFWFREMFPEPHSEKQIEDAVAYGLDGPVEAVLMDGDLGLRPRRRSRGSAGGCAARCSPSTATATAASCSSAASRSWS